MWQPHVAVDAPDCRDHVIAWDAPGPGSRRTSTTVGDAQFATLAASSRRSIGNPIVGHSFGTMVALSLFLSSRVPASRCSSAAVRLEQVRCHQRWQRLKMFLGMAGWATR
jgi:pimeloyl-ACP methyl ester carboxylesterase